MYERMCVCKYVHVYMCCLFLCMRERDANGINNDHSNPISIVGVISCCWWYSEVVALFAVNSEPEFDPLRPIQRSWSSGKLVRIYGVTLLLRKKFKRFFRCQTRSDIPPALHTNPPTHTPHTPTNTHTHYAHTRTGTHILLFSFVGPDEVQLPVHVYLKTE